MCLLIDRKGFLWSGTETGLYRYDGVKYIEYGVSNTDKGFAGYTVTNIFEDSRGTIWIGTSEALNKLDQKNGTFQHYFPDSSSKSDISNFIRSVREDKDGFLWILTSQDIYSFERKDGKFTRYLTDSLSWYPSGAMFVPEDQCFAEDRFGNKWFVTYLGLYLFNKTDSTFRMVLPDSGNIETKGLNKIRCINSDKDGNIWIGTDGAGLLKWDFSTNKAEKMEIPADTKLIDSFKGISTIIPDKNGSVWSFGNGSFSNYSPENKSIRNYLIVHKNKTVYEQPGTDIWIDQAFQSGNGTIWFLNKYAGLMFRFDPQTEKLCTYRVPNFIAYQCIMDRYGSFWFACIRNNIHRLVTDNIPYLTIPVNNSSHVAQIHRGAFLEDNNNRVYLLLLQGMYVFNKFDVTSSLILNKFRFPDSDTIAGGGFHDSKGNLWFGNKNGNIVRFNPSTNALTYLTNNFSPGNNDVVFVPLVREDKNGNIWIANNYSLFRFNRDLKKLDHILDFKFRPQNQRVKLLNDFLIDAGGNLWILISDSILNIRIPEMKVTEYGIPGDRVFNSNYSNIRLAQDSKGNIFLLNSRYGLYQFSRTDDAFVRFDLNGEDPGSEYYDLLIDRKDKFWIAYNRGIKVFNPQDKSSRLIKMPQLQFDVQSCQIKSGHILFLNFNQLYVFYEDPPFNNNIPPVYLTRLLVNGKEYHGVINQEGDTAQVKKLNLPYRMNTIIIEFAALNYLNPQLNRYRYFMTKRDKDTVTVSEGVAAEYKSIPPGRYSFWVTGSNNDGLWNTEGASLDIRIYPPWYRSVIGYLSYALLTIFLMLYYIRRKTNHLREDKLRLQSEIKAATSELKQKNLQLEEIDRIKTHFFTDISHEIRTPLSLILGPLENISKEEMLSSRLSGMIDMMKRNANRLMNLVNQMLDISRLDAGKMKITLNKDDIVKCIRILVYEFLSLAESKQIKYTADLPELKFETLFDRDKIEKIISNLLSNAFKYTPPNGVVQCIVRIERGKNPDTCFLKIRVADSGPGIHKDHQNKIFERFYRVEGHHETDGYGTGIGLSLVQEFVTLLRGEIRVESTPGRGSDFSVTLPLGNNHLLPEDYVITQFPSDSAENKVLTARLNFLDTGAEKPVPESRITILIIEDNEDLRSFIKGTLENEYVILESDNGKSGLNTALTMMPDLIVTDIMMPDLDGLKICMLLKNDERTSHIPIILLTAKATAEDKIAGLRTGADDYIVKPFNMTELSTRILNLLTIRNRLRLKYSKFHLLETGDKPSESVDDRFMIRVFKIISSNIRDYSFDVGSLMEQIGMSRTHLTRKLKILTGLSPGVLIRNIRLEQAAVLLSGKAGNITEIANRVGISNPASFTKSFRSYFGVSPRDYLKELPVSRRSSRFTQDNLPLTSR
jgi:signal transduction histidine kinase/CheY-like chemotaxis protein/ligand-binding sensor domain-containing protein